MKTRTVIAIKCFLDRYLIYSVVVFPIVVGLFGIFMSFIVPMMYTYGVAHYFVGAPYIAVFGLCFVAITIPLYILYRVSLKLRALIIPDSKV